MARTPEQWRDHLLIQLCDRRVEIARMERYHRGDHDMPVVQESVKEQQKRKARWAEFMRLVKMSRANWCGTRCGVLCVPHG